MELCDEYLHEYILITPTTNDFFKFKKYENLRNIQPNYFSDDYYDKLNKLNKKYLKILGKKDNKNVYDKVLERDLTYSLKYDEFKIYDYLPINAKSNFFFNIVSVIKGDFYFRIDNLNDVKIYIQRLKKLNVITDTIIKQFKKGIEKKVTMYYRCLDLMIKTFQNILKNKEYEFKKDIPGKNLLNEAINEYYVKNIHKLLIFFISEYYPHSSKKMGLHQYPGGKEYYKLIVQDFTLSYATPENIHQLGKIELKYLQKQKKLLVGKDEKKFIEKYEKKYSQKQKLKKLDALTDVLYKNVDNYFHKNLNKNELYKIKQSPEESNSSAYYYPSDFNREKKGTFYINLKKDFDFNELLTLSLHEGLPGHHYQIERLRKDENVPNYIKYFDNTSYAEGWGLYSENLYEYKNKGEYYHKLKYSILRACRLILDTGIHYYGWDYEKCLKFFNKNINPESSNEFLRYISYPGQALCYKIGEKVFLFLKDEYLKKNIELKDFHEIVLSYGPIPLDILIHEMKKKYMCKL